MIEVRASAVRFFSPMDEAAFFEWIKKLPSVSDVYGEIRDIVLCISEEGISKTDFHELIAIFRRYNIELRSLRVLVNETNEGWVKSWEPEIFY